MTDEFKFSSWMKSVQNPASCSNVPGVTIDPSYFSSLGLGAQIVSLKFNFLSALLKGEVYHFPITHYSNPRLCPSRSFECYFKPPSECSSNSHKVLRRAMIAWCGRIPKQKLSRMANLSSVHPEVWYHSQVMKFLLRPQSRLQQNIARLSMPLRGANKPIFSIHIRATDKHTEDHLYGTRSVRSFAYAYLNWKHWNGHEDNVVFLGSEDKDT